MWTHQTWLVGLTGSPTTSVDVLREVRDEIDTWSTPSPSAWSAAVPRLRHPAAPFRVRGYPSFARIGEQQVVEAGGSFAEVASARVPS